MLKAHAMAPQLGSRVLLMGGSNDSSRFNGTVGIVVKEVENGWIRVQDVDTMKEIPWFLSKAKRKWLEMPKSLEEAKAIQAEEDDSFDSTFDSESFCEFYYNNDFHSEMTKLVRAIFPEAKLCHLGGGAFNRVLKIIDNQERQYVLRWPREPKLQCRFDADVAILKYLELHAPSLPVPRVLHKSWSATPGPWVIHGWLAGDALSCVHLTGKLREDLARQVTSFFIDTYSMQPCHQPGYGMLVTTPSGCLAIGKPVATELFRTIEVFAYEYDPHYRAPSTLPEFLDERFSLMLNVSLKNLQDRNARSADCFAAAYLPYLQQAAKTLVSSFEAGFCLRHPDLEPHNFLVSVQREDGICRYYESGECLRGKKCPFAHKAGTSSVRLSAVLDWDDCEVLPPDLAYQLPTWLWNSHDDDEENEGRGSMREAVPARQDPTKVPSNQQDALLRAAVLEQFEHRLPGFFEVVERTHRSGLLGLGQLARHGLCTNGSAFLLKNVLERAGIDVSLPHQTHQELLATPDRKSVV